MPSRRIALLYGSFAVIVEGFEGVSSKECRMFIDGVMVPLDVELYLHLNPTGGRVYFSIFVCAPGDRRWLPFTLGTRDEKVPRGNRKHGRIGARGYGDP